MRRKIVSAVQPWGRVLLILASLIAAGLAGYLLERMMLPAPSTALRPLSLDGYRRILILAPHCDDETLGSAGVILAARRADIEVRVVIATNGDGYFFATAQDFREVYPRPQDYIRMGELRQQESLSALKLLGISSDQAIFLSYPDRGSPAEWNDHWSASNPYRSPFSRDARSPYPLTYDPQAVYAGEDYLRDVMSIIQSYRPDLIIYPHPEDVHPDHWGLNVFTRLAITLIEHGDPAYRPAQYTYLIHRPDFPVIKGLRPSAGLTPPPALYQIYPDWYAWNLTPADTALKGQAVQQYRSQLPLLRGLMESFVRRNELFAPVENAALAAVVHGDLLDPSTWVDSSGRNIPPVQLDPAHDLLVRDVVPQSDLTALYAAQSGDVLWLCGEARENVGLGVRYELRLKALNAKGILSYQARTGRTAAGWSTAKGEGRYFCSQVTLAELGNPWAIYVGADSESAAQVTFDRMAWQMIYLQP